MNTVQNSGGNQVNDVPLGGQAGCILGLINRLHFESAADEEKDGEIF